VGEKCEWCIKQIKEVGMWQSRTLDKGKTRDWEGADIEYDGLYPELFYLKSRCNLSEETKSKIDEGLKTTEEGIKKKDMDSFLLGMVNIEEALQYAIKEIAEKCQKEGQEKLKEVV